MAASDRKSLTLLSPIVLGPALVALASLLWFVFIRSVGSDKRDSMRMACLSNLMHAGRAVLLYASDNDNFLPPAATWCDLSKTYFESAPTFMCIEMPDQPYAFMLNQSFDGRLIGPDSSQEFEYHVLCFDGIGGKNLFGGIDSVRYRHKGRTTLFFLDGHGKSAVENEARRWLWTDIIRAN